MCQKWFLPQIPNHTILKRQLNKTEQQFIKISSAEACLLPILNEKQKPNNFIMCFFLKSNPFSQKTFCKTLDNFAWSFRCSAKYPLEEICMTVCSQFENSSDNSAGFFCEKCLCVHPFTISFSGSSSTLPLTCCWFFTYFQHIWSNVCNLSIRDFLHHLCDPSLDFLPVSSAGEPITGPCTPDVSHQAEQRARISSLDLLAMLYLMQPRILMAAFAARAC